MMILNFQPRFNVTFLLTITITQHGGRQRQHELSRLTLFSNANVIDLKVPEDQDYFRGVQINVSYAV